MRKRHQEEEEEDEAQRRTSVSRTDGQHSRPQLAMGLIALLGALMIPSLVLASVPSEQPFADTQVSSGEQLEALPEARANPLLQLAQPFASSQGIVVAKRPALIAGLNQQFKNRQGVLPLSGSNSSTSGQPAASQSALSGLWAAGVQLVGLGHTNPRRHNHPNPHPHQQQQQPSLNRRSAADLAIYSGGSSLGEVEPEQQQQQPDGVGRQALAPAADGKNSKLAHSMATLSYNHNHLAPLHRSAVTLAPSSPSIGNNNSSQPSNNNKQAQLYKGYSLIELEVRSESDRRFVQELYGNLSAALTELAQQPAGASSAGAVAANELKRPEPASSPLSPYADIDFWSFKCALNDHIDIMVSPKSRPFIVNQLNGAKIKHRVKIDDIQARLEAQQQQQQQLAPQVFQPATELSGRQQQQQQQQASAGSSSMGPMDPLLGPGQQQLNDSSFFENYQRVADINQYVESLVGRARDVAQVQVIGRSSQGRYLRVLRLGYEQRDVDGSTSQLEALQPPTQPADETLAPAPLQLAHNGSRIVEQFIRRQQSVRKLGSIWLDGGTHAREWISPATVLYISFRLADNHARCLGFFDHLRMLANQIQTTTSSSSSSQRAARAHQQQKPSNSAQLDSDLLNGINEINSSLLDGSPPSSTAHKQRARSELELKLELLGKRPQELASEHACDLELEQLLRRYTFYVMPVLNPDGYEYSHTHNRLWRKTRSTSNHPIYRHFCLGADPNRNYDARHGSTGSSGHPCSQTYGGATPFTEPETRHQSNFVYAHRANMKMFISFHSYSQMILLPYSHSKQLAPDHKDLESVGQAGVKAIERTHGTQYRVGPSASILYTASGTASDWAYEKAGIKYSYTIELRDTGAFGFLLPRQQIIPTGEETFNGLLAMINQMEKNDHLLSSKSSLIGNHKLAGPSNGTQKLGQHELAAAAAAAAAASDYVHAPDLDQLRPLGRFRARPAQLENALDGSDTWATPQPAAPGVRDRRPQTQANSLQDEAGGAFRLEDENVATSNEEPDAGFVFEGEGELMEPTSELADSAKRRQLDQHQAHLYGLLHASQQQDEATGQLDAGSPRLANGRQTRLSSGQQPADQGQILRAPLPATMGLSANGRTLINVPPQPSKAAAAATGRPRRESSEDQRQFGAV